MLANLRELRVMGCIYFLSNECIITELWLKSTSIGWYITWILAWKFTWLGWGDHRDVWGCSASGARVLPQSWLKAISLRVLGVWFACVYITFAWWFTLPWNKPTWSCLALFLLLLRGEFGLWLHLQFCVLCVELLYFIIIMQNEEVAVHLSLCNSSRTSLFSRRMSAQCIATDWGMSLSACFHEPRIW